MRPPIAAGLALAAVAGCGRGTPQSPPAAHASVSPPAAAQTERPAPSAATTPGSALPPLGSGPRYVGRWAARVELCREGAWIFRPSSLITAGEVSCEFTSMAPTSSGYEIAALCRAEGPPKPARLRLTFAESARAMLVEGGPFSGETGLIWCGTR